MQKSKFQQFGWLVAALLGGVIIAGGFQGPTEKTGVVDINKLVKESDFGKKALTDLQKMQQARGDLINFVGTNRIVTRDQAKKLQGLWLLPTLTDAQKGDLERLKSAITTAKTKYEELVTKATTPDEKKQLDEYSALARDVDDILREWKAGFTDELRGEIEKQQNETINRARDAVRDTAKAQGFTVVFEAQVAPYGANDLTDASLRAMNAKKN